MRWIYTTQLRIRSLFRRSRVENELDAELRDHVERQIEAYVARGLTPEAARRAALLEMGGVEQRKEECRDVRRTRLVENLLLDLRYGARALRLSPGFTAVALLSLALGIGANTAIFQLLNAVRLRSLPVRHPNELAEVVVAGGYRGFGVSSGVNAEITHPLWEQIRQHQQAFSGVFAWGTTDFLLGRGAEARPIRGLWTSGDFFTVLGISPARGRLFSAADDRRGCGPGGAVISYGFWQSHFGGAESAIGQTLDFLEQPFHVIGVTPKEFSGLEVGRSFDVALPVCAAGLWGSALDRRNSWWLVVMGRLNPNWSVDSAAKHFDAMSPALFEATLPPGYSAASQETYRSFRLTARTAGSGVSRLRTSYERSLWLLLGMTGLVLLVACANLVNLLLARASAREQEIAVRLAIGASRARLVSQLLCESLLLAGGGAALGLALARPLGSTLLSFLTTEADPLQLALNPDWRVFLFTTVVATLTCLAFGLVPALRASHVDPGAAMKSDGRRLTTGRERFSFQRILVIAQLATSFVLVVVALLFVRSFHNLITLDAGVRQDGILFGFFADFSRSRLPAVERLALHARLLDEVRSVRHVESAAISTHFPLSGGSWTQGVRVAGAPEEQQGSSKFTYISQGYFRTLDIPILDGRDVTDLDTATSHKVVLVNETFVRRFIGRARPLGTLVRTIEEPGYPAAQYEVIGVVKDTKYADLREETPPISFVPIAQQPSPDRGIGIVIRTAAPPADVIADIRRHMTGVNPDIGMQFKVFETQIRERLVRERLMAWLAGAFGALAALLAAIGVYGMLAYMVLRRRHELGIRLALGASRARVIWLIVREMAMLFVIGLVIGSGLSRAAVRGLDVLLFGLASNDGPTLWASAALLAAIAGLAIAGPAWRAARVDPMVALRCD